MRRLSVFNQVSVDGYFSTTSGDVGWTHRRDDDAEFKEFVAGNASGGGTLVFGRKTYDMMASFWPTAIAAELFPHIAPQMNQSPKVVFSRTLGAASWSNTTLVKGDLVTEIGRLKRTAGGPMAILGSGSLVAPLAEAGLIDELQVLVIPVVLGEGRTMFAGIGKILDLNLKSTRTFRNGNAFLVYEPRG